MWKTHPQVVCACTCVCTSMHVHLQRTSFPSCPQAWPGSSCLLRCSHTRLPQGSPPPPPTWPFLPTLPHFMAGTTSDLLPRPGSRMQGSGGWWEAREASEVHRASIQVLVVESSRRGNLDKRKIQRKEALVLRPRWDTGRPAGAHRLGQLSKPRGAGASGAAPSEAQSPPAPPGGQVYPKVP